MDNSTLNHTSTPESAPKKEPWMASVLLNWSCGDDAVSKPSWFSEVTTTSGRVWGGS